MAIYEITTLIARGLRAFGLSNRVVLMLQVDDDTQAFIVVSYIVAVTLDSLHIVHFNRVGFCSFNTELKVSKLKTIILFSAGI